MRSYFLASFVSLAIVGMSGCGEKGAEKGNSTKAEEEHSSQNHPDKGPHGGSLIELGNDEYHGEFVHDDKTCNVSIYILDSSAKNAVPIESAEVVINLKHDGKPEQYRLAAVPLEGEGGGKSSRFAEKQKHDLCHAIEEKDADARLQVTIAGQSYTGRIVHDSDHPQEHDHDHEHDHEKK